MQKKTHGNKNRINSDIGDFLFDSSDKKRNSDFSSKSENRRSDFDTAKKAAPSSTKRGQSAPRKVSADAVRSKLEKNDPHDEINKHSSRPAPQTPKQRPASPAPKRQTTQATPVKKAAPVVPRKQTVPAAPKKATATPAPKKQTTTPVKQSTPVAPRKQTPPATPKKPSTGAHATSTAKKAAVSQAPKQHTVTPAPKKQITQKKQPVTNGSIQKKHDEMLAAAQTAARARLEREKKAAADAKKRIDFTRETPSITEIPRSTAVTPAPGPSPKKSTKPARSKSTTTPEKPIKHKKLHAFKESVKEACKHPVVTLREIFTKENSDYDPRSGKFIIVNGKKIHNNPRIFSMRKTLRNILIMILAMIVLGLLYTGIVIATAPKIDPTKLYDQISQSSVIYDEDGKEYDTVNYGEDRTVVKYNDLPKNLVNAFVSLEDKTFWTHHGFNWIRMIGAVKSAIFNGGDVSGTSTITQQLARNVYLPNIKSQRSIKRKILEMYYAACIEHTLSKKQIFAAYVNSIYYGLGNYGIEAASETYFSKHVSDLSLEECAAMAALPQSPDSYAFLQDASSSTTTDSSNIITVGSKNYICNDISKSRRDLCLSLMKDQGYITTKEYNSAHGKDLKTFINPTIKQGSTTSYFTDYVVEQVIDKLMKKYDMSYANAESMVYSGGLKIHSTIDSQAQSVVEKEFSSSSNFPSLSDYNSDSKGNITSDAGSIILYSYGNMIDSSGNFVFADGEYSIKSNGDLVIKKNKRLNIYKTTSSSGTNYSLEFKSMYVKSGSSFYIYPGGYINIPAKYKKLDSNGNLVISSEFLKKSTGMYTTSGGKPVFTAKSYTMQDKVIQPQGAMVITEVGTGEIKAMVGGRGISGQHLYNRATKERQPGSSIKPLSVYSTSLQMSYDKAKSGDKFDFTDFGNDTQGTKYYGDYLTPASIIVDEPITINGKIWPKNSYSGYQGKITMRNAMRTSCNVCAVKLYEQVGAKNASAMVKKFGISTLTENDMNPAALALGGLSTGVSTLEMAEAYATFPNGGERNSSIAYTKVTDSSGKTLLTGKSKTTKVLDEGVAFIMTDMLKTVVKSGTGTLAGISGVQAGGKTGTTSNNYDIWFDGFTPTYAASLWIGTDVNIQLTSTSEAASALWGKIMNQVTNAKKGSYKDQPSDVIKKNGEYFMKGTASGLYTKSISSTTTKSTTSSTKNTSPTTPTNTNGTVPSVAGKSLDAARSAIVSAGFTVGSVTYENNSAAKGTVISQGISGTAKKGSAVSLVVSNGPAETGAT